MQNIVWALGMSIVGAGLLPHPVVYLKNIFNNCSVTRSVTRKNPSTRSEGTGMVRVDKTQPVPLP
jgi:hypothetical protein